MKYIIYIFAVIGLLTVLMTGYSSYQFFRMTNGGVDVFDTNDRVISFPETKDRFRHDVYLSSFINPFKEFSELPEGNVNVFGHINFNGEPAVAVKFGVVLNGEYEVAVTTDSEGKFSFDVPEGNWVVNALKFKSWVDKPEGDFVIVTGEEARFSDKSGYYKSKGIRDSELKVHAQVGKSIDLITLKIERQIDLISPAEGMITQVETPENFIIEWSKQLNSKRYSLKLSRVEKLGTSSSYYPVGDIQTDLTELPLSQFRVVKDEGEVNIYKIEVFGFDDDNGFVSESPSYGENTEFELVGYKIADQRSIDDLGDKWSPEVFKEYSKNRNRVKAVRTLIDEGLLEEAEGLIERITANSELGKIDALKGYISAKRGNCEQANRYFNQALSLGGKACVPDVYRQGCLP